MQNTGRTIVQMKIEQATTVIIMAEEKSNSHVFIPPFLFYPRWGKRIIEDVASSSRFITSRYVAKIKSDDYFQHLLHHHLITIPGKKWHYGGGRGKGWGRAFKGWGRRWGKSMTSKHRKHFPDDGFRWKDGTRLST